MQPLIDKAEFIDLEHRTWLYTGAESPPLRGGLEALREYMEARCFGPGGREKNTEIEEGCREQLAALLNGSPDDIALLGNASEAIATIAMSLGLSSGDNVVVNTLEFPSGIISFLALKELGVEVRVVPHHNWEISLDNIMQCVDANTRAVMTSHVSYISGARLDYKSLHAQLCETNALLLLDATQALGVVPVDMNHADFVVSSSFKWLLGTHGVGILAVNPERTAGFDRAPRPAGWRGVSDMFSPHRFERFTRHSDARSFELGYPSYPTLYTLDYSLDLLARVGRDLIEDYILHLGGSLIDALRQHGYEVMTPHDPARRAGNISIVCPEGEALAAALRNEGIYVWGGDGRVRASVHAFNDQGDVDRYIEALNRLWEP